MFVCLFCSFVNNVDPFQRLRTVNTTLTEFLISLQQLLAAPEPNHQQNAVVARQYKEQREIFHLTAKYWAHVYAGGFAIHKYDSFTVPLN